MSERRRLRPFEIEEAARLVTAARSPEGWPSEEQMTLRDITEWWDRLPPTLRQDIEGSGNVPGCIARARRLSAAPAAPASGAEGRWPLQDAEGNLRHRYSCRSNWDSARESDCDCDLECRMALSTEQAMHAAWRKRAEEAEAKLSPSPSPPGWEEAREAIAQWCETHAIGMDYANYHWSSCTPEESATMGNHLGKGYAQFIRSLPAPSPSRMNFVRALSIVEQGFNAWRGKEHNAKWLRKITGTPIHDLLVHIAQAFEVSARAGKG